MTPAEIITATGGALSATLIAAAAVIKALRGRRTRQGHADNSH